MAAACVYSFKRFTSHFSVLLTLLSSDLLSLLSSVRGYTHTYFWIKQKEEMRRRSRRIVLPKGGWPWLCCQKVKFQLRRDMHWRLETKGAHQPRPLAIWHDHCRGLHFLFAQINVLDLLSTYSKLMLQPMYVKKHKSSPGMPISAQLHPCLRDVAARQGSTGPSQMLALRCPGICCLVGKVLEMRPTPLFKIVSSPDRS